MCGIVGAISERNILPILLEGLQRLEYRGYDSAGVAVIDEQNTVHRKRTIQKIDHLKEISKDLKGYNGIAHTRWATHGEPATHNAHPHLVDEQLAIVHNGILENYRELKQQCIAANCQFQSETDSEVILHLLHQKVQQGLTTKAALKAILPMMHGAYALGVINSAFPDEVLALRYGGPLVVGIGLGENYFASDVLALLPVTQNYIMLEEGDLAVIGKDYLTIEDAQGNLVYDNNQPEELNQRQIKVSNLQLHMHDKGEHKHFMHKEIFEQSQAISQTLQGRLGEQSILQNSFGVNSEQIFRSINRIQIIACGTSYHAGLVFKYWCEDIIQIPVMVEVASEFRYRNPVIENNVLFIAISQSGETADTISAIKIILEKRQHSSQLTDSHILTLCNNAESTLVSMADLVLLTHAGPEIGVASTKAFTTQLVALAILMTDIGKIHQRITLQQEQRIVDGLRKLPELLNQALQQEELIIELAQHISNSNSMIFLGRGAMFPVALEGALKLKEISYIHAEAFAAGELKHGPLALVDQHTPVIVVAPNDDLLVKLKSNLEEVSARGGRLYVFADSNSKIINSDNLQVISLSENIGRISAPIIFSIPLQLLAYHVALNLGKDIDQPRNLAKSVTVE